MQVSWCQTLTTRCKDYKEVLNAQEKSTKSCVFCWKITNIFSFFLTTIKSNLLIFTLNAQDFYLLFHSWKQDQFEYGDFLGA